MKRIFNLFIKEESPQIHAISALTSEFNEWVSGALDNVGIKRFNFNAHTNKFMVRKWLKT